jgi:hypothetical protein
MLLGSLFGAIIAVAAPPRPLSVPGAPTPPLSAYLKQPAPPAVSAVDLPKADTELVKKNFFEYLDFALQFAPAGPEERVICEKLACICVGANEQIARWSTGFAV